MVPHHTDITALATPNSNQVIQVLKKHRTNRMVPKMSPGRPLRCHGIASPKDTVCLSQLVAGTHSSNSGYLGMLRMLLKKDQNITEEKRPCNLPSSHQKFTQRLRVFSDFWLHCRRWGSLGSWSHFHNSSTNPAPMFWKQIIYT